jgi:uncharacterized protein (TIGR00725 family)
MKPGYISVVGGGDCSAAERALAEEVGRLVAQAGATLVCGGLGGVMEAAARGAKKAGGVTIGILPGHDRAVANPYLDHIVTTGIGHARNLAVVSSGDAVIAIGGGYGTLSEIALAAKIGRPVVVLAGWRMIRHATGRNCAGGFEGREEAPEGVRFATTAPEAVRLALASVGAATGRDRGNA